MKSRYKHKSTKNTADLLITGSVFIITEDRF